MNTHPPAGQILLQVLEDGLVPLHVEEAEEVLEVAQGIS